MHLTIQPFERYVVGTGYALSAPSALVGLTGRVTIVSGESGTGKSVLLKALAGLRPRASTGGTIDAAVQLDADQPPVPLHEFLREPTRLSYLPQHTVLRAALTPERTIRDWCALLTAAYGNDAPVRRYVEDARRELEARLFSLEEQKQLFGDGATVRIRDLSGGQKRRLDVMMALCSPAELVLLDEPDTGLDAERRRALFATLVEFAAQHARIILLVSHYAGEAFDVRGVDTWQATRFPDCGGASFSTTTCDDDTRMALPLHDPPPERGNQRLDQFVIYARQRCAALRTGRTILQLAAAPFLMGAVRLAMYPSETVDGPAMGLLFFFSVTCFWLGTVQTTGFWSDEQILFTRECRQGTSSLSYLLSFIVVLTFVLAVQIALGALVLKGLSWTALLQGDFGALGKDLHIGLGRIVLWGCWAGINGLLAGWLVATLQHLRWPKATSPGSAQLLALVVTLSAIVFSFPVIGSRAYTEVTDNPFHADRLSICGMAVHALTRTEIPALAIVFAEMPAGANPSFHGLWFQGERPLRYRAAAGDFDAMQKEGVPEALSNAAVLMASGGIVLGIARCLKHHPPST